MSGPLDLLFRHKSPGFPPERFPASVTGIIATGEKSGRIDRACDRIAEYVRDDAEAAVDRVAGKAVWILPCLFGAVVLFVAIWFFGQRAPAGLPSPGEMWHNLLHGPGESLDP